MPHFAYGTEKTEIDLPCVVGRFKYYWSLPWCPELP